MTIEKSKYYKEIEDCCPKPWADCLKGLGLILGLFAAVFFLPGWINSTWVGGAVYTEAILIGLSGVTLFLLFFMHQDW